MDDADSLPGFKKPLPHPVTAGQAHVLRKCERERIALTGDQITALTTFSTLTCVIRNESKPAATLNLDLIFGKALPDFLQAFSDHPEEATILFSQLVKVASEVDWLDLAIHDAQFKNPGAGATEIAKIVNQEAAKAKKIGDYDSTLVSKRIERNLKKVYP